MAKAAAAATETKAGGVALAQERTIIDKIMYGSRGPPAASDVMDMKGLVVPTNSAPLSKALQPLVKEKSSLEEKRTQLELDFLRQLATILTKDQAATLAAVCAPST